LTLIIVNGAVLVDCESDEDNIKEGLGEEVVVTDKEVGIGELVNLLLAIGFLKVPEIEDDETRFEEGGGISSMGGGGISVVVVVVPSVIFKWG
jgi:hypothetical protein